MPAQTDLRLLKPPSATTPRWSILRSGGIRQDEMILAERGWILLVHGEHAVVGRPCAAIRTRIEHVARLVRRKRHARIQRRDTVSLGPAKRPRAHEEPAGEFPLGRSEELVLVRRLQIRIDLRYRAAEAPQEHGRFVVEELPVVIRIDPSILVAAQAVGIAEIQIAASQRIEESRVAGADHQRDSRRAAARRSRPWAQRCAT